MRVDFKKVLLALAIFAVCGFAQAAGNYGSGYDDNDYHDRGYYNNDGYNGNYGYGSSARTVTCESRSQRTVYCDIVARGGIRISRQLSSGACIEGSTWGWDGRGVWVSGGCRAQFVVGNSYGNNGGYYGNNGYGNGNGGYNGYGAGYSRVIRCESVDSGTTYCGVGGGSDVRLVRRLSQSACIEGSTWGRDRRGLWVSDGCRAEFRINGNGSNYYGNGYGNGNGNGNGYGSGYGNGYGNGYGGSYSRRLVCESRDGHYNFCRAGTFIRQVQIYRQLSSSRCDYNYNWGYRGDGVWVNNGCRAEFLVY